MRLDLLLIERFPSLSRRKARDVIEKGQVDVAGRTVTEPGRDVSTDISLVFDPNRKARRRVRLELPVLYEDDTLVVVDKPAGLLSVPAEPGVPEDCVLARVKAYAERLRPHQGFAGAVHRLDRDTSGALAVALDPKTQQALRGMFRAHRVERKYLALVAGRPATDEGVVDAPIRDAYVSGRRAIARPGEPSKPALTRFRVVERFPSATLLEVTLETGRQHQIRIHLAHVGLPVLGDPIYVARRASAGVGHARAPRQMLHAERLAFEHPLLGNPVEATSPLPDDFEETLRRLRRSKAGPPTRTRGRAAAS